MSRKKDPDFLSWESDIDLDDLLGEYTDHENETANTVSEAEKTDIYVCPLCSREYKSISGFRGHVTKKHDKNLKACEHKKGASKEMQCEQKGSINDENLKAAYTSAYNNSLNNIIEKPIYNIFGISNEAKVAKHCKHNEKLRSAIQTIITDIFKDNSGASCNDREKIFSKLHQIRTNENIVHKLTSESRISVPETLQNCDINNFLQVFLLEIVGEIFKSFVNMAKLDSEMKSDLISDNDTKVLYYISGYIIRALKTKYGKIKNKSQRESKLKITSNLISKTSEKTSTEKFTAMFKYKNRGGLMKPSDDFFYLVREFENLVRRHVDHENLYAKAIMKADLKEVVLDAFMVKHYSNILFTDYENESSDQEIYLEDCLNLFLTVRGYAVAKLVNKRTHKYEKEIKKSSESLRDALKSVNINLK